MRFSQLALTAAVSCFAASAYAAPVPGSLATVGGRAHIEQLADGTHIILDGRSDVSGFVAFDNKSTFPNIDKLDGRKVQITGVVNDELQITLTDPNQIKVID